VVLICAPIFGIRASGRWYADAPVRYALALVALCNARAAASSRSIAAQQTMKCIGLDQLDRPAGVVSRIGPGEQQVRRVGGGERATEEDRG
jgi:hypothetical protein